MINFYKQCLDFPKHVVRIVALFYIVANLFMPVLMEDSCSILTAAIQSVVIFCLKYKKNTHSYTGIWLERRGIIS